MPEGIRALKLYTSETKASGIMSTDFEILFKFNDSNLEDIKKVIEYAVDCAKNNNLKKHKIFGYV